MVSLNRAQSFSTAGGFVGRSCVLALEGASECHLYGCSCINRLRFVTAGIYLATGRRNDKHKWAEQVFSYFDCLTHTETLKSWEMHRCWSESQLLPGNGRQPFVNKHQGPFPWKTDQTQTDHTLCYCSYWVSLLRYKCHTVTTVDRHERKHTFCCAREADSTPVPEWLSLWMWQLGEFFQL